MFTYVLTGVVWIAGTIIKFSIRLYCFGCVAMTREWVLQDNITPAVGVVQMMFASMPKRLRQIYGL